MPNVLTGPCPHCGATVHLQVAVLTHAPGSNGNGSGPPQAHTGPPQADRPTCDRCGSQGAILEQVVSKPGKNQGRRFRAYTCSNEECPSFGDIIPNTFRFLGRGAPA